MKTETDQTNLSDIVDLCVHVIEKILKADFEPIRLENGTTVTIEPQVPQADEKVILVTKKNEVSSRLLIPFCESLILNNKPFSIQVEDNGRIFKFTKK